MWIGQIFKKLSLFLWDKVGPIAQVQVLHLGGAWSCYRRFANSFCWIWVEYLHQEPYIY